MNALNSVIVEGNIVRDAELKHTTKGNAVCNFSIASNRWTRRASGLEKEVSFFKVESWGELAESCHTNCPKGRGVRVVGRLQQDRWEDGEGNKHEKVKIVADHVEFRPIRSAQGDSFASPAVQAQTNEEMSYPAEEAIPVF